MALTACVITPEAWPSRWETTCTGSRAVSRIVAWVWRGRRSVLAADGIRIAVFCTQDLQPAPGLAHHRQPAPSPTRTAGRASSHHPPHRRLRRPRPPAPRRLKLDTKGPQARGQRSLGGQSQCPRAGWREELMPCRRRAYGDVTATYGSTYPQVTLNSAGVICGRGASSSTSPRWQRISGWQFVPNASASCRKGNWPTFLSRRQRWQNQPSNRPSRRRDRRSVRLSHGHRHSHHTRPPYSQHQPWRAGQTTPVRSCGIPDGTTSPATRRGSLPGPGRRNFAPSTPSWSPPRRH